jgi:hypothetical protein
MEEPIFRGAAFLPNAHLGSYSWLKVWRAAGFSPLRSGEVYVHGNSLDFRDQVEPPICLMRGLHVTKVSLGSCHALAITSTARWRPIYLTAHATDKGQAFAWGDNIAHQLGLRGKYKYQIPVEIPAFHGLCVTSVAGGGAHSLAVTRASVKTTVLLTSELRRRHGV